MAESSLLNRRLRAITAERIGIALLGLIAFAMPLGEWQGALDPRLSVPRIVLPILVIIVLRYGYQSVRLETGVILIAVFALSTLPSFLLNGVSLFPAFAIFIGYVALFVVVTALVQQASTINRLMLAYVVGLTIVTFLIWAIIIFVPSSPFLFGHSVIEIVYGMPRLYGTEINPNAFAVFYIIGILVYLHFLFVIPSKMLRYFLIGPLIVIFFITVSLTGSRSAVLAVFVGSAVIIFLNSTKHTERLLALCLVPAGLLYSWNLPQLLVWNELFLGVDSNATELFLRDKKHSIYIRQQLLLASIELIIANPLVGVGFTNTNQAMLSAGVLEGKSTHNTFTAIGIEFGIISLLSFVAVLAHMFYRLIRSIMQCHDPRMRGVQILLLGCLTGYLVNGMFHESYMNVLFWLLIALAGTALHQGREAVAQDMGAQDS